jgi:hypothetical protein
LIFFLFAQFGLLTRQHTILPAESAKIRCVHCTVPQIQGLEAALPATSHEAKTTQADAKQKHW